MPFTPAHAVAALPFRESTLPLSAVVIGTLSPDFDFYLRLAPRGTFGHTFQGMFVLDLPLSLLALWLYENTVRPAIEASAPGLFPDGTRLPLTAPRTFLGWLLLTAAVMFGVATHIALDSFTHSGYWPYAHFAALRASWQFPGLPSVQTYMLLQCGTSVIGMGVLWLVWSKWIRSRPGPKPRIKPLGWWMLASAFLIAIVRAAAGEPLQRKHLHPGLFVTETLITLCSALMLELVIVGLFGRKLRMR